MFHILVDHPVWFGYLQLWQMFLDLSQSSKETGTYPRPVTALHRIVTSLRHLTHLDISSTNLASQPSTYDRPFKG
uniref:Ovule protein n=1 Tax=Ascaris lumbricoides TaxID=6252 RepID=A0A0M3HJH0_ASCLU